MTAETPAIVRRRVSAPAGVIATVLICTAVTALATLNQSAVHWRDNAVDDHLFAWHGWCVSQGARPYLDIWDNKPPGIWWLNAAAFRVAGEGPAAALLICTPAVLAALLALVGITRRTFHPSLALPAALFCGVFLLHPALEFGGNRTETFVVACETIAIWAFLRGANGRPGWFILSGFAAGSAPLFKQSGIGAAVAIAIVGSAIALRAAAPAGKPPVARARLPRRALLLLGIGGVLPVVGAGVALLGDGALGEALDAVVAFNRAYFDAHDATWLRMGAAIGVYAPVFRTLAGLLISACIGIAVWAVMLLRRTGPAAAPPPTTLAVIAIWFVVDAYLACVGPGRRGHHFLPAVPALSLLALAPLHALACNGGLVASLARRSAVVVVLLAYAIIAAPAVAAHAQELRYCWSQKPAWWRLERTEPAAFEAQAIEIRRVTTPSDEIYVWGWSPGTYRFAYRRCPSRFATLEKLGQVGERAAFVRNGAIADIIARPPRILVISPRDLAALPAAHPEFAAKLAARYRHHDDVRGMTILKRRE